VRVQVANGTEVTGLARKYTQRLVTLGWDALPEVNGPATTVTVVYYHGGFSVGRARVAQEIKVKMTASQALARSQGGHRRCSDDVIVVFGHDLVSRASCYCGW
jgi:hypothetical protein